MTIGLFEHLGVAVPIDDLRHDQSADSSRDEEFRRQPPWSPVDLTRKTSSDADTYDDDAGVARLGFPPPEQSQARAIEITLETREDGETYDDDPGLGRLAFPGFGPHG